ncbi:YER187Wp-like protein, partial [Saccharomyces cerevisiae AWRI1631]
AVIVAAVLVGKSSGSATKRGLTKTISVLNHTITFTDHILNGQTLSNGTGSNFVTIGFSGYAVHDTIKRDSTTDINFVGYTTEHGTHISTSSVHNVSSLIDKIVAAVPGVPDTGGNASALSFQKRSQEFATSWISMTYDQSYGDLAQTWQNDEGGAGNFDSYAEEELQNFFSGNRDWKYCFAAEDTKSGEPIDYDDIPGDGPGTGSAFKSEIYFNTYGGIDNYCNDEHIGAQNTGDGR